MYVQNIHNVAFLVNMWLRPKPPHLILLGISNIPATVMSVWTLYHVNCICYCYSVSVTLQTHRYEHCFQVRRLACSVVIHTNRCSPSKECESTCEDPEPAPTIKGLDTSVTFKMGNVLSCCHFFCLLFRPEHFCYLMLRKHLVKKSITGLTFSRCSKSYMISSC